MQIEIKGAPAFSYPVVKLEPGESLIAESGAMSCMDPDIDMKTGIKGGLLTGLIRKFLGGESLFINTFTNRGKYSVDLYLTQGVPGDVKLLNLQAGEKMYIQPGAFICADPNVKYQVVWAGIHSLIGGEGLFRICLTGPGQACIGAYGGIDVLKLEGDVIVDSGHLVAYPVGVSIKTRLSGGLISSFTSGEGFVMQLKGRGDILIQTRSERGLVQWVNRQI